MSSIFHRIWFGDKAIPEAYENYWAAWQRQYPDCEFITWTDADIDKLPLCRDKLNSFSSYVSRADLARYEILYEHGGIYLDCDIMPYNHFPIEEMTQALTVCNETESREYCSIGFIGAPAGHIIFKELIDHIVARDIDETRPNVTTGPWLFGSFLTRHPHKRLGTSAFYPYLYDEPLAVINRRSLEQIFGIHVWGGSWLSDDLKKDKALTLLKKGDIQEPAQIIANYDDQWADDVRLLMDTMRDIRVGSVQVAPVLHDAMAIDADDHLIFEFAKMVFWLLDQNADCMIWQIGAADGMLVDPLRPVMINYDPPALLLEPNPYMFAMLEKGYQNNRNATLLPLAYATGDEELVLNAINPDKVKQAGLPRWVLGISSVYEDKNALGGKTIDADMTRAIQACVEKVTVPVIKFDDLLAKSGGRLPDILVVDAEGMDKVIIDDILSRDHLPMVIHFEVQCLEQEEQKQLLSALEPHYVLLEFGNDMTAYRSDVIMEYAKSLYINHGIPTIFTAGLQRLNGL